MFALPVVRRPSGGVATLLGGGYHASGAAGADRLPAPYLPRGLRLDPRRAPARCRRRCSAPAAASLRIGDRVYLRHAKAGELCERFDALYLVSGGEIVDEVPTYRGEGRDRIVMAAGSRPRTPRCYLAAVRPAAGRALLCVVSGPHRTPAGQQRPNVVVADDRRPDARVDARDDGSAVAGRAAARRSSRASPRPRSAARRGRPCSRASTPTTTACSATVRRSAATAGSTRAVAAGLAPARRLPHGARRAVPQPLRAPRPRGAAGVGRLAR